MTTRGSHYITDISTHSLTKRLTGLNPIPAAAGQYFNSQPHEEADAAWVNHYIARIGISTHSLTKRLTPNGVFLSTGFLHFNSQPHEEADKCYGDGKNAKEYFNSQPHEEADGNFRQKYIYLKLFFTLIAHINLVFYSNHYIVNFFLVKYTHFLVRMS